MFDACAGSLETPGASKLPVLCSSRDSSGLVADTPLSVCKPLPANGRRYLVWLDEAVDGGWEAIKHWGGIGGSASAWPPWGWRKLPQLMVSGIELSCPGLAVTPCCCGFAASGRLHEKAAGNSRKLRSRDASRLEGMRKEPISWTGLSGSRFSLGLSFSWPATASPAPDGTWPGWNSSW